MMNSQFDVIVFGATSFVGQILAQYLTDKFNHDGQEPLNWAIAGRSQTKLDDVKTKINQPSLTTIVADAHDEAAIKAMCEQAKVIISTVGPYALYGETLVKVCAEIGTDYCDLTGEVQWIDRMLKKYEASAKASGARIVHCSGFDSIPSDMGVYYTQREAHKSLGEYCSNISMRVKAAKGGASGGTIASILNITKEVVKDPALRKDLVNPYLICPENHGNKIRQFDTRKPTFDSNFNAWTAPFIMAAINTRVVFRSNALTGNIYGANFKYDEAMLTGKGFKGRLMATAIVAGIGAFFVGAALKPTRWVLENYVLPKPGEGPTPKEQVEGYYDIRFVGKTPSGKEIRSKVVGQGDPGYGSTSQMLGQVGACLALDNELLKNKEGGFWTTSTLLGDRLIERLEKDAQLKFEVLS
ncbi:MAG: saccharopine dehydrogenase NADP-binding domain-containing protein [Oleispira sp.]|nr:saccharopine dehydrogenase NADP-binding domain-containing protein [Oleispira sp.]